MAITGTSRGLGRSLAEYFLSHGYKVMGCSRDENTLDHPNYQHTCLDVSDEAQVRKWIRFMKTELNRIDVMICSASLVRSALYLALTPSNIMKDFLKINIAGVFFVLREVSKLMMSQGFGKIITISSTLTALHVEGTAVYSATKSAVTEMTKILAKELAPKGITCNVIAPALMDTGSSRELAQSGDWQERMLKKQTFPRVITMEEVCHTVEFLISPLSKSITGQVIYIGVVD